MDASNMRLRASWVMARAPGSRWTEGWMVVLEIGTMGDSIRYRMKEWSGVEWWSGRGVGENRVRKSAKALDQEGEIGDCVMKRWSL